MAKINPFYFYRFFPVSVDAERQEESVGDGRKVRQGEGKEGGGEERGREGEGKKELSVNVRRRGRR